MKFGLGILVRSVLLCLVASAIGLLFNWLRADSVPLRSEQPLNIYRPCPERSKEATPVSVEDLGDLSTLVVIDSRPKKDFDAGHLPAARSLPYDLLNPTSASAVEELRRVPAGRLLVVGESEIDSGRLLSGELASAGLLGVRYLRGGFDAWVKAGRTVELGEKP